MKKCKCGFKTWNNRRFKKHLRKCDFDGQAEQGNTEGQEVKEEQAPEAETAEVILDEGIDYEDMTIHELRKLAREEGLTGIYSKSKAELIEALREGE